METNKNLFVDANHSSLYKKFRPSPPLEIIGSLQELVQTNSQPTLAIDVGCGSGQCTELLSQFFDTVIGFDVSKSQIKEATARNKLNNVTYKVSAAEKLELEDESVDLITCCQSFHWFNGNLFLQEASRLLKNGGVLGLIAQEVPNIERDGASDKLSGICKRFRDEFKMGKLNQFWKSEANRIENGYDDVVLPFEYVIRKSYTNTVPGTGSDVVGFLESWSCVQTLRKVDSKLGDEIIETVKREIANSININVEEVEKAEMALVYDYGVLIGRKKQ